MVKFKNLKLISRINKLLFISTILFIVFSFSPISINFNALPSVSKTYAVSNINQEQLDQTASILSSIQSIINKLKIDIQSLFGREARAQADITTGLVGYWKFDEGVGATAADSSGNGNTGTLVNNPTWTIGKVGTGALSFDGVDDYVTIPSAVVANYPFTICAWFKSNNATAEQKIISIGNNTNDTNVWDLTAAGHVAGDPVRLDSKSGSTVTAVATSGYTMDNWHFACGVGISSTNREVYINAGSKGINITASFPVGVNATAIGRRERLTPENYFSGSIDEVRVYNRSLTQAEITELYNYIGVAPPPPDTTPPTLSSGSPTGALPAGTTQTTLSLTTNENSTCKYGTTLNTAYASIANTFTTTGGTSHSQTITGLTNGTSYNYYVRCSDVSGNANTTDYTISFSVSASVGDTIPPVVSITSPTNGATVSGTITISANATDNVAVTGVQFKLDNANLGIEDTISPYSYSLNTATITDGSHTLTAVARDTSNNYATSSIITITINNASPPPPDITAPSTPINLTAIAISSSQINLSWTASTDNVGVAGYKIYRCSGAGCTPTTQITTSPTNSYSNTGLTASTAYTYAVSAYDAVGNESGKSSSASATTLTSTGNTYYISPVGNDTTGNGSNTFPWATLKYTFSRMAGGDTLIIKDGTYSGINNVIDGYNAPPNGSPSGYTIIKAEQAGKVTFDGNNALAMFDIQGGSHNYLQFEGLKWINSPGHGLQLANADHVKFLKCGAESNMWNDNRHGIQIARSTNILLEDCYVWGQGRFGISIFISQYVIVRRTVVRLDAINAGGMPIAHFMNYSSGWVECQNCIAIDSDSSYFTNFYEVEGSFTTHNAVSGTEYWPASHDSAWRGSLGLNVHHNTGSARIGGMFFDDTNNLTFENIALWDVENVGMWGKCTNCSWNHFTIGKLQGNNNSTPEGKGWDGRYGMSDSLLNSVVYGANLYGLWRVENSDYNVLYNNAKNYFEGTPGINDKSIENGNAVDPLDGNPGNGIAALKYLPRIENNSDLYGSASDGGNRGAVILKKIGVSGTLYGELGYNEVTNEDLWPFPYEDQIKSAFASYNPGGTDPTKPDGKRGFAADGNDQFGKPLTLTRYIWQYLGNQIPCEIYSECGGVPDTQAPTTPTNLFATAVSSSQINLSWTASTDNVGVAGYKIYRCAGSGCTPTTQIATSPTNSYSNTGLTVSTAYTYAVSAYDAANNESPKSSSVLATTQSPIPQCSDSLDNDNDGKIDFGGLNPDPDCSSLTDNSESDTTPPTISSVISTTLASTTARIDWITNEPATSLVEYGFTTQYGASTTLNSTLLTSHSVSLSNLSPDNTTYNFRVRSKDSSNNESISINYSFITPGLTDIVPPASTTNLTANNITQTSVDLVTWTAAGDDGNNGTASQFDVRYTTNELSENNWNNSGVIRATGEPTPKPAGSLMNYTLVGLTPNTTYKAALKTLDEILNQSLISNIITFTTLKAEVSQTTPQTTAPTPSSPSSGGSSSGGGGGGGGGSFILTDTTPPPLVANLESEGSDKQTRLTWKNPESTDYVRTIIVRKELTSATSTHATSTKDGAIIYEGTDKEFTDANLKNNQTYLYSIFTIDRVPNYSSPATTTVKTIQGKMTAEIEKKESFFAKATKDKPVQTPTFTIKKGFFKRNLKQGMKGDDVKKLQEVLYQNKEELYEGCNAQNSKQIQNPKSKNQNKNNKQENANQCSKENLITGYFGKTTKLALIKFQEKYKEDILKPAGLISGTGILGKVTVRKMEDMYGENSKQTAKGQTEKEEVKKEIKKGIKKRIIRKKSE